MKNTLKKRNALPGARMAASCFLVVASFAGSAEAGSCEHGCMTLCNKTGETVWVATLHVQGPLGCAFSGSGCSTIAEGWWRLNPNQCFEPNAALFWETYYSIFREASDGSRVYPQWPKDQAVLSGKKYKGLSGYSGYSICVDKKKAFSRKVSGKPISAFNETCPSGYVKSPVNLYTRAEAGYSLSYSIK